MSLERFLAEHDLNALEVLKKEGNHRIGDFRIEVRDDGLAICHLGKQTFGFDCILSRESDELWFRASFYFDGKQEQRYRLSLQGDSQFIQTGAWLVKPDSGDAIREVEPHQAIQECLGAAAEGPTPVSDTLAGIEVVMKEEATYNFATALIYVAGIINNKNKLFLKIFGGMPSPFLTFEAVKTIGKKD